MPKVTYEAAEDFRELVKKMTITQIAELLESACISAGKQKFNINRESVAEGADIRFKYKVEFE